ncbi:MAG: hypothetical protein HQL76_06840, partial [Magnetococcales bacterium]|nr:hypothetical protein [Magnetococcales bacterium]
DSQFSRLSLWQDTDANARTDAGELNTLAQWGITAIDLNTTPLGTPVEGAKILSEGSFDRENDQQGLFSELALHVAKGPQTPPSTPDPVVESVKDMDPDFFEQQFMTLMESASSGETTSFPANGSDGGQTYWTTQQIFGNPLLFPDSLHQDDPSVALETSHSQNTFIEANPGHEGLDAVSGSSGANHSMEDINFFS